MDWASRSVRRRARSVDEVRGTLSTELGRPPTDAEVAAALGMGLDQLKAHRDDVSRASVLSLQGFDDSTIDDVLPVRGETPADVLEHRERLAYLRDAVERLPERLRAVVEGYFFAERPMAELAAELGVTESRISQLRAEAVALLKDALNSALDPHLVTEHARPTGCAARRREAYFAEVASHRTFAARLAPAPYEIPPHNASGSRRSGRSLLRHGPWTGRSRPTQGGKIMGLRINQNIAAMNAYRNLSVTDGQMSKSLEKLSSGFRINRAADDAAGLAISEGLRAQTGGLKVAVRNAQDGVSVVQTAEGALTETHSILQRMRDLAVQASNEGSQGTDAQAAANTEYQALALELDDIANKTTFNGTALLDGTYDKAFQVGANSGEQLPGHHR